jgi:membrane-associated phospholipid phosphatase
LPSLRSSEWLSLAFFAWIAAIAPFFPRRPHLGWQPVLLLGVVLALVWAVSRAGKNSYVRDFLPLAFLLMAFREMELFLPPAFDHHNELLWIRWDRLLLEQWGLRAAIESAGPLFPGYLEFCYLLVYGLGTFGIAALYVIGRRASVDRFLFINLIGTLAAYALFPYFPTEPPRYVFPGVADPTVTTALRTVNLWILKKGTIHIGVFPSAHVSSAFSAAWAMFAVAPERKRLAWGLVIYSVSVSIATIYGRYHYAADVAAGMAISAVAGLVAFLYRRKPATQRSK